MKKNYLSRGIALVLFLFATTLSFAQQKKYIAEGDGLAGIWVQMIPYEIQGQLNITRGSQVKIINTDGTFYGVLAPKDDGVQGITFYGDYKITSDSTYVEHIVGSANPKVENTNSDMKYKLLSDDVLKVSFKNNSISNGKETSEIWLRAKQMNKKPFAYPEDEIIRAEFKKILSQYKSVE